MSNGNSINVFDDIQSLCKAYRLQLKQGERKRIEDFLDSVGGASREILFQNLLLIDVEYRRRQKQDLSSDDYISRFPQYGRLIRQAFFESTMMSQDFLRDTPADEPTLVLGLPAARRLGEYELQRELGRGGFGVVYEARHLQRNDMVALKTLPSGMDGQKQSSGDAERLHKFRREFRSLSEINHPNLVGMQTLEVDGDQWFFTMDLIDGVDFLDYVRPAGRLDEQRLRVSLTQLVRGIIALHDQGIVHRDLKPSNVLASTDGQLTILDFGLVTELQHFADQTLSIRTKHFVGTPRYAAPEQASGQRTETVDWYAVGVMLYEAITGEVPFKKTGVDLIVAKQTTDPPALGDREGFPQDLTELVDAMLRRDPKMRPGDEQVANALGLKIDTHDSPTNSSMAGVSVSQTDEFLVGRESQFAEFDRIRESFAGNAQPEAVFISGRSGEGKTKLAEKFISDLRRDGKMLVLAGRCYDRESVPFKAIDCLIDPLVAFLRARTIDEVNQLLPDDIGMLAQLFPVLRRVEAIADRAALTNIAIDSRQIRYRAFAAFRELLRSIGRSKPLLLFIDDLQWGDADSATVLLEMLKPPDSPAVMLLGSYRSDEASESPFLTDWREKQLDSSDSIGETVIEVTPLTQEQSVSMIASRLGVQTETLRQKAAELFEDTRGNPYILEQLIEWFERETGQLRPVPLEEIIARKLARLPSQAAPLLNAIAIAGQAASLEEIAAVANESSNAFAILTHMRSERLVRLIGSDQQLQVDTYHDKIRETVLSSMPSSDRRLVHLQFAETIERNLGILGDKLFQNLSQALPNSDQIQVASDRVFDLAHHCFEAQDARAFVYQVMAAERAMESYAIDDALRFYERAEELLPSEATKALRFRVFIAKGRVLLWNRNSERAIRLYERAVEESEDQFARARALMGIGDVHKQSAHFDRAIHFYDEALSELGAARAKTNVGALFSALMCAFKVFLIPPRIQVLRSERKREHAMMQHRVLFAMSPIMSEKSLFGGGEVFLRDSTATFQTGEKHLIPCGYSQACFFLSACGWPWIGNLLLKRSSRVELDRNDPEIHGANLYSLGVARFWGGSLQDAERSLQEAIPLLRRCGDFYTQLVATHMLRHVYAYIGSSSEELRSAMDVLNLALKVGNSQCICWGQYDIASAQARCGAIAEASQHMKHAHAALTDERFYMTETIRGSSHGYVLLQASDYQQARDVTLKAWKQLWRCPIDVTMLCLPVLIESIAGPRWDSRPAESDITQLKELMRYASLLLHSYPNHQAHLLRVSGRGHFALGNQRKAMRKLEKSVKVSRKKKMDYQCARALLDLAAVKKDGRNELRCEAIELLKQQESVIPYAERWLMGDQFDQQCVAPAPVPAEIASDPIEQLGQEVEVQSGE